MDVKVEEVEDEEPVLALDLRIGKATESISIFDDKNVLASTSSGFGPAQPRAGQARLAARCQCYKHSKNCFNYDFSRIF